MNSEDEERYDVLRGDSALSFQSPLLENGEADDLPIEPFRVPTSIGREAKEIVVLSTGLFFSRASWVFIQTTNTALVGHVSAESLAAVAVSELWMSSTGVILMGGVLGIFVGNAVGAGNARLAHIWIQVSLAVLIPLTVLIMGLWVLTGPILSMFGVNHELLYDAGYFGAVMSLALPARTVMGQISEFLGGHQLVKPEAMISLLTASINLVAGLFFVLGVPVKGWHGFGFDACPWVTVATESVQVVLFFVVWGWFFRLHVSLGFPGLLWKEITRRRVLEFLKIYFPAALSSASDFWRMSAIGAMAAHLGNLEVATFNASYRILWMTLTVVGSLAYAVRVRLANFLGAAASRNAQKAVAAGCILTCGVLVGLACAVLVSTRDIAELFTNDGQILALFQECRVPLSMTLFFMNLSIFLEQIPLAMGRTRTTFWAGAVGSWLGQVPFSLLSLNFYRNDLYGLYVGVASGYLLLCVILGIIISLTDYRTVIKEAQHRNFQT